MKKYLLGFLMVFLGNLVSAQCAMCRTQVVNNVSAGEENLASGLNQGILYLFSAPYLLIGVLVVLWFKFSKVDKSKKRVQNLIKR